jgi:hypothetical protein
MRRLVLAIALACVLSGVARAGEIPSTGAVAQPTPSPVTTTEVIHTTGEIYSTGAAAPQASSTILTIIVTLYSIVL